MMAKQSKRRFYSYSSEISRDGKKVHSRSFKFFGLYIHTLLKPGED